MLTGVPVADVVVSDVDRRSFVELAAPVELNSSADVTAVVLDITVLSCVVCSTVV